MIPRREWERRASSIAAVTIDYHRQFRRSAAEVRRPGIEVDGGPTSVAAFVRTELPARFRLWVGIARGWVRRQEMIAEGHLVDHRHSGFDEPVDLGPPV